MAMTIHVDIVSAEAQIYSGLAEAVYAKGAMGELGIMPGHTPLLTSLQPGQVRLQKPGGGEEIFYISGGVLEVQPHLITVLADTAARAADLDESAAIAAKEKAEKMLTEKQSEFDYTQATAELAQAIAQLRTIQKLREKH
ncbi:F0F1 ATP synthase subunit epsilon [soil metagenome]